MKRLKFEIMLFREIRNIYILLGFPLKATASGMGACHRMCHRSQREACRMHSLFTIHLTAGPSFLLFAWIVDSTRLSRAPSVITSKLVFCGSRPVRLTELVASLHPRHEMGGGSATAVAMACSLLSRSLFAARSFSGSPLQARLFGLADFAVAALAMPCYILSLVN